MTQTRGEQLWKAVERFLHPRPNDGRSLFVTIGIIVISLCLISVMFLSSPLFSDWWGCTVAIPTKSLGLSRESAKHLCDWLVLVSQIVIVVTIGGIYFTESFARKVADVVARVQQTTLEALQQRENAHVKAVEEAIKTLEDIPRTSDSYRKKLANTIGALNTIYGDGVGLPTRYFWFVARGLVFHFPGGLYGFLAFLFLLIQMLALSTKIVLDYLPDSCHW
jgi:hypothetical protein